MQFYINAEIFMSAAMQTTLAASKKTFLALTNSEMSVRIFASIRKQPLDGRGSILMSEITPDWNWEIVCVVGTV